MPAILPPDSACDCLVPWLDGAGNHSPGCSVFRWREPGCTCGPPDDAWDCDVHDENGSPGERSNG